MASVDFNKDGLKITSRDPLFEAVAYAKFCEDVYDRIDTFSEHAECVSECLQVLPALQKDILRPLNNMGNGLKLEVALLRGNLGSKDLTRPNVPLGLWNAIETGFDSISSLEVKRNEDLALVGKMEKRLLDCEEASDYLISLQSASDGSQDSKSKGKNAEEAYGDEEIELAKETFGILNSAKGPSVIGNKGLLMVKLNQLHEFVLKERDPGTVIRLRKFVRCVWCG